MCVCVYVSETIEYLKLGEDWRSNGYPKMLAELQLWDSKRSFFDNFVFGFSIGLKTGMKRIDNSSCVVRINFSPVNLMSLFLSHEYSRAVLQIRIYRSIERVTFEREHWLLFRFCWEQFKEINAHTDDTYEYEIRYAFIIIDKAYLL